MFKIFKAAVLFNHILSIIRLPDAIVSGHPTGFGSSKTSLFIWAGRRIKRYSLEKIEVVMGALLSGLIGALIATLLSVIYHHNSERKKMRSDVLLEVVPYCDDIYRHLTDMHIHKDHEYTDKKPALNADEYRHISRELTGLLLSSKPAAKLALAYGEGKIMALFNELKSCFLEVLSELRGATRSGWIIENKEVSTLFSKKIDPLRANLEKNLFIRY